MRNLYKELAEYTGRSLSLVIARCQIANVELAWLWEQYKDNPIEFYRNTDLYIFNLTRYQMRLQENKMHNWFEYIIRKKGWQSGFDYGGGIGEQTILAFDAGVEYMIFKEVANSKTLQYAKHRFSKHIFSKPKKTGRILEVVDEDAGITGKLDFVVAMDILEHLENPKPVIENIYESTEWLFCNPEQIKYNCYVPQHISKFDLTKYFKHEDLYLWRRK